MRSSIAAVLVILALLPHAGRAQEKTRPDALRVALDAMGIAEKDLGYRPRAHWSRYPQPAKIPHLLPFFVDLLAHPLDTYEFTRTLGNGVEDLLTQEQLTAAPTAKDRKETLFRLGVLLGTDRRMGGFRGYSANLEPRPFGSEPLLHACMTLLERSGKPLRKPMTFGSALQGPGEDPRAALRAAVQKVPEALRLPLARYLLNLIQAREWIDRGLRDVPPEMSEEVFGALPTLSEDTPDGTRYYPVLDDVAKRIDEGSLHYGCLKALQATQDARRELEAHKPKEGEAWPEFEFELATPWGSVRFMSAARVDEQVQDGFVLVALQTEGVWGGGIGATGPTRPLCVALLFDHRGSVGQGGDLDLQREGGTAEVAAGIVGCGLVYVSGAHKTTYRTGRWGLGAALFGMGVLIDEGGDDRYTLAAVGQGAAYFGAGLLLDAGGDDEYRLLEGDGQGMGGAGGIGILADRRGDDWYYVEPDASKAGRADYHSKDKVAANNAQGVGAGRRGDGSDGHNWAGGLGALLDVDGNDRYRAGNFSQGLGYWYGTGLLWDGGGDDIYRSVYFTQGSGAHFAIGALIDESGNDRHELQVNAGAAFGFGWDVVNAFLLDRGEGDDTYEAKIISTGLAEVRSNAFFIDEGGDDTYLLDAGQKGFGDVDEREGYRQPRRTSAYSFHLAQVGLFLDLGGTDRYLRRQKQGPPKPDPRAGDNRRWNLRARDKGARHGPNVSFGGDFDGAVLGFLKPWPARKP